MSIRKGNTLIAGNATFGYRPPLLQSFWSDHILNRPDLLRADTFSWQSGKMYKAVYKELVSEYDNENSVEETEGGITFKRTPNGYKIADSTQETAILEKYNTDGIAWYYVLGKDNIQFKLPRTKFGFEGLRDSVGNDIEAGLPNINGNITFHSPVSISATENNAFSLGSNNATRLGGTQNNNTTNCIFSAHDSNPTYGNSDTVQERATQMYLYFYVGNYTQSAIEETAGLNAELFNNKADKTEVDGEWIELNEPYDLMRDVSLKGTTYLEFDLSSVIPNDEYKYECLFNGSVTTGSTSGNWGHLALSNINITIDDTELINVTPAYFIGTARTRTSSSATTSGSTTMPLLNDSRKVYVRRNQHFDATGMVQLVAYHRLGKIGA